MSHKRKANDAVDVPILALGDLFRDERYSDLAVHIGSFWTGKEFSSHFLAARASKGQDRPNLQKTSKAIVRCLVERCLGFLDSVGAPDSMKEVLKGRADDVTEGLGMKQLSEWCALLDYCESMPLRLSESRLDQDEPIHPLWIVGAGTFVSPKGEANAILSVPSQTWRPELLFLGEKWMVDFPRERPSLEHCFFMDPREMAQNIGHTPAVLSWDKDGYDYLAHMHRVADIEAGMLVYHKYPAEDDDDEDACYLNWICKAFSESMSGRFVREALSKSDELRWMMDGTEWDSNMLASVEVDSRHIPADHMDQFGERIVRMMKEVEKWYDLDEEEEDEDADE